MIIYGWNSKNIKQAPLEGYECASCQQKNSFIAIFADYVHIFWIPLFPYRKSAIISCAQCQLVTREKGMPSEMKAKMKQLKSAVSIPKYLFSGLAIIILAIAYFTYSGNQSSKQEQSMIDKPQIGDVYVLKSPTEETEYDYYFMKVNDVYGDSLLVTVSSYQYNGMVSKLDPNDGFLNISIAMHKDGIKDYDESGELRKVIRDYDPSSGFDRVIEYGLPDSVGAE